MVSGEDALSLPPPEKRGRRMEDLTEEDVDHDPNREVEATYDRLQEAVSLQNVREHYGKSNLDLSGKFGLFRRWRSLFPEVDGRVAEIGGT